MRAALVRMNHSLTAATHEDDGERLGGPHRSKQRVSSRGQKKSVSRVGDEEREERNDHMGR